MKKLQSAQYGYLMMSVIFYLTALIYMTVSEIPPMVCCSVSGILFILYGTIKIIGYFSNDLYNLAFQHDLACGLFLIVLGILVLICRRRIVDYLSVGLGVLILLDSLLKVQTSIDAMRFGFSTWNRLLSVALTAGVFGALVIAMPFPSNQIRRLINGCALLSEGLMNQFVLHYALRKKEDSSQNL